MVKKFSTLDENVLNRWHSATQNLHIPNEALIPQVRVIKDPSGKSDYSYGLILNPYRFKRYDIEQKGCGLCSVVNSFQRGSKDDLDIDRIVTDYVITPNIFPTLEGVTIAIHDSSGKNERKPYSSRNLSNMVDEISKLITYTKKTGFRAFHNGIGAGASVPQHEHWHLTNFGKAYDIASSAYGFDSADLVPSKRDSSVYVMPGFPYAHLVFQNEDIDKLVNFLRILENSIGGAYANSGAPHTISQGERGLLVVPFLHKRERGIGGGDVAGHIPTKSRDLFESGDYNYCNNLLEERLFKKYELNPEFML